MKCMHDGRLTRIHCSGLTFYACVLCVDALYRCLLCIILAARACVFVCTCACTFMCVCACVHVLVCVCSLYACVYVSFMCT